MATTKQMDRTVTAVVLLTALACSQEFAIQRPSGEPTQLVNELTSLASQADVKQLPEFAQSNWVVIEDSQARKSPKTAKFDNYVMMTDNYTVGSVNGSLRVEFLNGMLMATWFYPGDYQKCVDELAAAGVVFPTGTTGSDGVIVADGNTTIRLGKDYEGRRYVAWEDRRLIDQMDTWLLKHS